jgi:hypothetical protein
VVPDGEGEALLGQIRNVRHEHKLKQEYYLILGIPEFLITLILAKLKTKFGIPISQNFVMNSMSEFKFRF